MPKKTCKGFSSRFASFLQPIFHNAIKPFGNFAYLSYEEFFLSGRVKKYAKKIGIPSFAEYILLRTSNISITN